jgi:predicted esterase
MLLLLLLSVLNLLVCGSAESTATIEPEGGAAESAVIFMHGLGGSGSELRWMADLLKPKLPHTRFIFPSAPERPITVNGGMRMPAWYDIASLDAVLAQQDDVKGLKRSAKLLRRLAEEQLAAGVQRVAIGGFSQGGAVALFAALIESLDARVSAVVALSTYLPSRDKLGKRLADSALHSGGAVAVPPVLMCHGKADGTVQYKHGKASAKALKALGVRTIFRSFKGLQHSVNADVIADVAQFLRKRLAATETAGERHEGEL